VGESVVDVLVDGVQSITEFGRHLGLVGGEQRGQDAAVDLGVEDGEPEAVGVRW
jgi:hypothetical protein